LHPTGWCYWQALDSGGWGLIQSNPGENYLGPANRKYFILAQYARHIRPGLTIIDGGEGNTVAAYDPARHKLVLVTVNYGTAQWITYNLTNFPAAAGPVQRWTTITGGGPSYQPGPSILLSQRSFTAWFPTNSIQTFEIQNVDFTPPPAPSGLSATAGVGKVNLTWSASSGATNYLLRRATGTEAFVPILNANHTNYTDSAVVGNMTYTYEISAINGAGESAPSMPVRATPHAPPSLIAQIPAGSDQLLLSWPAWAGDYLLYSAASLKPPVQWLLLTNVWQTNETSFLLKLPLLGSGMYFYQLKAALSGPSQ
jgi:hypothetical protein